MLDSYDHQNMERPSGSQASYILTYEECKNVIARMKFGNESELFGKEIRKSWPQRNQKIAYAKK